MDEPPAPRPFAVRRRLQLTVGIGWILLSTLSLATLERTTFRVVLAGGMLLLGIGWLIALRRNKL